MKTLLHPTYFPSISHYAVIANSKVLEFEIHDNFQKQTNRNRMYIYGANGIQLLTVPVKKNEVSPYKYQEVKIEYAFDWQKNHFKSVESAYRNSPFFEFYIDDILPLFQKKHLFLLDLNFEIFETINKCLHLKFDYSKSNEYVKNPEYIYDYRFLTIGKKNSILLEQYTQVFTEKHGFISDLSILDLLFNEGSYAHNYLKSQIVTI